MMNASNLKKMRGAVDPLSLGLLFSALIAVIGANNSATYQQAEAKQQATELRKASFTQQIQEPLPTNTPNPCKAHCKIKP